jgi:tRNA modification GTPase
LVLVRLGIPNSADDFQMSATIYALSSGAGRAGVAVVRVSGPLAGDVLKELSGDVLPSPRAVRLCRVRMPKTGEILDEGLSVWFPSPRSFTGEDIVEFHIHGGAAVVASVLRAIGECGGTRLAEPGEFTKRAFLNDKMDLTVAEGLADLIDAETEVQRRQARRQASGVLGELYESWRTRLMRRLAYVEAAIDFPDEELPESILSDAQADILVLELELTQHLDDGKLGERLRSGIEVAILGPPNAGKSSLMNALAGRDAAIVSETAGTTRDVIEVRLDLAGFPVVLSDTAGLREVEEGVEAEGIRRARERGRSADIRVVVLDGSSASAGEDSLYGAEDSFTILNKIDIGRCDVLPVEGDLGLFPLSVRTGEGIADFISALTEAVRNRYDGGDAPVITRARHRESVAECLEALQRAKTARLPELVAEDLRLAMRALGRITGTFDVEDLLDIVFRDFCIGK